MRRTRLPRMYLPKVPQKDPNAHPLQVQNSQHFLRTAGVGAILTVILSVFLALRQVQQRSRLSEKELLRKRKGQRVVIIGGGAGGSAVAALIANSAPDLKITVIEKDKQQVFLGHVPLAHVGHRSYDIATSTGVDIVRSPAAWNVTRDANLVAAEVLRVDPDAKKVFVRTTKAMLAAATVPSSDDASERHPRWGIDLLRRCWPSLRLQVSTVSINNDGSTNLSDGTTVFSYDALVVAAGAHRSLGSLAGQVQPGQLDTHRIAVNPGTTRDNLVNLFSGNVLHVKVPPASFVLQMEAARALMTAPHAASGSGVPSLDLGTTISPALRTPPPTEAPSTRPSPAEAHTFSVPTSLARWFGTLRAAIASPEAADAALIPDEVAERVRPVSGLATTVSPLDTLAQWCMHYSSRQHDSTFVSSVNTIWKYLHYYNKLSLCHYMAVTADPQPIGPAPRAVNEVIEKFWRERQLACQQHSGGVAERFHLLFHSYLAAVDTAANVATLYDYRNNVEVRVPYNLLVLDLPLCAPSFVRQSGLHRMRYVDECVMPALRRGIDEVAAQQLRRHPLLRKTRKELEAFFADEASFMDVDHETLQHRRYAEIFALGDVAGVPSLKSYGAVSAQVPVVAHNVQQVLASQRAQAQQDRDLVELPRSETSAAVAPAPVLPKANAKYTGYSSFHVVMTTWRAMWPEMCYDEPQTELRCCSQSSSPADLAEAATKRGLDVVAPLAHCDHHLWDSLAWRDLRGFLNGLFHELALYEVMYFFIFSRGLWHSPSWFYVPTYSPIDGTPRVPTWKDLL
ncbi:Pyridine nucleotide-disulfide oxidoreductase, putative [Leishmania donovani]|uniref:Pyridine nucleotide-disulfide oxidoreductase, putative n=1 Tax=Leishmania donovani TaxID=5661 RepID=A0A3Q8IMW0_LEIDO|nr:Pyridine nucleotide-disulfide oxidoreductase, putative [Leishmania donovani]